MKTKTSGWRWIVGGLLVVWTAGGCAVDQQQKQHANKKKARVVAQGDSKGIVIGDTTYWNRLAPSSSDKINHENYSYYRQKITDGVSYEESGYYFTYGPDYGTDQPSGRVGTFLSNVPDPAANPSQPPGPNADRETDVDTLITHPGGSPNSYASGIKIRITHPGG